MQYSKIKDTAKIVLPRGSLLTHKTLKTMEVVSSVVGSTLGPGGCPVLIERQENDTHSIVTKDGVSVFRAISFADPVMHEIMATARDAAIRTATSAGDGTTTATILAEAIVRLSNDYLSKNASARPQRVVRELEKAYQQIIEPTIRAASTPVNIATPEGRKLAHSVAKVSANGDVPLADAVLECFDLVGDDGNVTLLEESGPSGYRVEALSGYPLGTGYEDSCNRFFPKFINDSANQRVYMEKPVFLLYYGNITDFQQLFPALDAIDMEKQANPSFPHNIVLMATGFSESVLGALSFNWGNAHTLNIYPCVIPRTPESEGPLKILQDLSAYTGATLFEPIGRPLDTATIADFGYPMDFFEASRMRSTIVGTGDELEIIDRVNDLKVQAQNAVSILDKGFIEERIGKLTGGIAKLTSIGSSIGELREKRDRAEDAVMAVRGAMKHGVLPAGGWGLLRAIYAIEESDLRDSPVMRDILIPALLAPIRRLLSNIGLNEEEIAGIILSLKNSIVQDDTVIYDAMDGVMVDAFESGLLDSTPAVVDAIQNSLSIASLLGTLGGAVVFGRDLELERQEAEWANDWVKTANTNEETYDNSAVNEKVF